MSKKQAAAKEAAKRVTFVRPLGDEGIETDIRTGRPLPQTWGDHRKQIQADLEKQVDEGVQLSLQLADPTTDANVMLQAVLSALDKRVEELAAQDTVCQSLVAILASVGARVRIGPEMARKKLEQYIGRDFPGTAPKGTPAPRKKRKAAP